jgi:Chondroitin N-acetylgalactosaminyltransferase
MSRIFYLTAVYQRWDSTFGPFLMSFLAMAKQPENSTTRLVILDWDGGGKDIFRFWPESVYYVNAQQVGHINRAQARNLALEAAQPADEDLVFFVDCDMVLPTDFSHRVRRHVKPGQAYFPICYSLYRGAPCVIKGNGPSHHPGPHKSGANGWWREAGRGNCGFVYGNFREILGRWDGARFGTRYGREDDDIYWRCQERLTIFRERVPGFFHQWHPRSTEEQNPSVKESP